MTSAPPSYPASPGYPGQGYPGPGYPGQGYPGQGYPGPGGPPPAGPPVVPPPPPGPGVRPPFPAPPVEGRGRRIGWGLGIGAGVLVLVCGGGMAAVVGLVASMSGALNERAHKAVTQYLDALRDKSYDKAYGLLCRQARDEESPAEFRRQIDEMQPIRSYQLGKLDLVHFAVPVDATYTDGDTGRLQAYLGQDQQTGEFKVCDLAE